MAKSALRDRGPIPAEKVFRMRGEDPPEEAAAADADELAKRLGDTAGSISSCWVWVTMGTPRRSFPAWLRSPRPERTVIASYVEFVGMWRLTLTPPAINAARKVAFLASGAGKADRPASGVAGTAAAHRAACADHSADG